MIRIFTLALSAFAILFSVGVHAAEKFPFENEINARKSFMQVNKFNLMLLGSMVKGVRDYDADLAKATAANMHLAAQMNNAGMWPKGSDNSSSELKEHTDALIDAWRDYETLAQKQKAWLDATDSLAENAGNGIDALKKSLGAVGKSCKGCHDDFKQQK